jgi:hypothetical protein
MASIIAPPTRGVFLPMCELRMIDFLSVVSPSLISRRQISFLAFHGCTAGNSA